MSLTMKPKEDPEERTVTLEGLATLAVVKDVLDVALAAQDKVEKMARPYKVPLEDTFEEADFLPAHDLDLMLTRLINKHETLFSHLVNLQITCLWKAKGGASKGKKTLGKVQAATGLVGYFSECDFVIWLAADNLRGQVERVIEACLMHEALHISWNMEDGKVQVVDHDFAGFTEEIRFYGLWRVDLEKMAKSVQQLPLFEQKAEA